MDLGIESFATFRRRRGYSHQCSSNQARPSNVKVWYPILFRLSVICGSIRVIPTVFSVDQVVLRIALRRLCMPGIHFHLYFISMILLLSALLLQPSCYVVHVCFGRQDTEENLFDLTYGKNMLGNDDWISYEIDSHIFKFKNMYTFLNILWKLRIVYL